MPPLPSLKYGLNIQKKSGPPIGPPTRRKPLFAEQSSDEEDNPKDSNRAEEITEFDLDKPLKLSTPSSSKQVQPPKKPLQTKLSISEYSRISSKGPIKLNNGREEEIDPSIYDYDAAFDAIHAKDAAKKAAEQAEASERKPKYIGGLLNAAEQRKRDLARAEDKKRQREREAEGEEFADKEKFVTDAYKRQQEDLERERLEQEKREEEEQKKRRGQGMAAFNRNQLDRMEKEHQAAMAAAAAMKSSQKVDADDQPRERTEAELAWELNEKGANVIINEEGQVADKRQLLSAGLNVAPRPKPNAAISSTSSRPSITGPVYRGRSAQQQATRERQTKMMEEQMLARQKRAADEEAEELRKREQAAKSRKTEADKSSARERYLSRKRAEAAEKGG